MVWKIALTVSLSLAALAISGCGEETDQDTIIEAQYCLDTATASTVSSCTAKVANLNSPAASMIRCSADYIAQGFGSPSTLVDAINNLQNPVAGASASASFLAAVTFPSITAAQTAYSDCVAAEDNTLALLAGMTLSATNIANLAGVSLTNPTATEINSAIATLESDPTADTDIGTTVQTIYSMGCQAGEEVNTDICTQMTNALATLGTDPTAAEIGAAILSKWNNN
jgi:hypothetical protein